MAPSTRLWLTHNPRRSTRERLSGSTGYPRLKHDHQVVWFSIDSSPTDLTLEVLSISCSNPLGPVKVSLWYPCSTGVSGRSTAVAGRHHRLRKWSKRSTRPSVKRATTKQQPIATDGHHVPNIHTPQVSTRKRSQPPFKLLRDLGVEKIEMPPPQARRRNPQKNQLSDGCVLALFWVALEFEELPCPLKRQKSHQAQLVEIDVVPPLSDGGPTPAELPLGAAW